jgi:hypothetical protein
MWVLGEAERQLFFWSLESLERTVVETRITR